MALLEDNLENIKASILVAIKNELTETYPKEFGDYKTGKGDMYTKVFWGDTIRYQPRTPYCMLVQERDKVLRDDEVVYKKVNGITVKKQITRSKLEVTVNVVDMGNEATGKTALQADNFAHKVARQLRKYFSGDDKLYWFEGNEYYDKQIGIRVDTDIDANIDWDDTDTIFNYNFTVTFGWNDEQYQVPELARGAEIRTYHEGQEIDNETIYFKGDRNGSTR